MNRPAGGQGRGEDQGGGQGGGRGQGGGDGEDGAVRRPRPPGTPEELRAYAPYLMNRLMNRYNADQNRDLGEHGSGGAFLRILSVLYVHETLTVNEIAAYAVIEQSNASRTVETMVRAGLAERRIAATDLRRRQIVLTESGRAQLERLWPVMAQNHARLVDGIPAADMEAFVRTLRTMLRNVREEPI